MRKLVVSEFVSLDGVMEAPGGDDGYVHGAWTMPYWDDEVAAYKGAEFAAADALLLGRVTYQGFAAAWPQRTDEGADYINAMAKYVVSSTLETADWNNTTILPGDPAVSVADLKAGEGADILVAGSCTLVAALLRAGLVDELRLAIYPVVLGVGKRIFPADLRVDFDVAEINTSPSGVILTSYLRRDDVSYVDPATLGDF